MVKLSAKEEFFNDVIYDTLQLNDYDLQCFVECEELAELIQAISKAERLSNSDIENYSCVDIDSLLKYKGKKEYIYGCHISDLVIYDKPKELSEFKKYNRTCYYSDLGFAIPKCSDCGYCNLKRPFQSWGYVEGYNE